MKSDPCSREKRLGNLLNLLGADVTTADRLARALRVSTRTIYRDIVDLRKRGYPVKGEASMGYQMRGRLREAQGVKEVGCHE